MSVLQGHVVVKVYVNSFSSSYRCFKVIIYLSTPLLKNILALQLLIYFYILTRYICWFVKTFVCRVIIRQFLMQLNRLKDDLFRLARWRGERYSLFLGIVLWETEQFYLIAFSNTSSCRCERLESHQRFICWHNVVIRGAIYLWNPMYKCPEIRPKIPEIQPEIPEIRPEIFETRLKSLEIRLTIQSLKSIKSNV